MRFDRNLYSEAWRILCILWPYALLAVFTDFAVGATLALNKEHVGEGAQLIHVTAVMVTWGLLLYMAHTEILSPDCRDRRFALKPILWFTALLILIYLLVMLSVIAISGILIGAIEDLPHGFELRESSGPIPFDISDWRSLGAIVLVGLAAAFAGVLTFVLLGTTLPAFVATNHSGFRRAFRRGRRQFFWMAGRLIAGPVFVVVCAGVLLSIVSDPPGTGDEWIAAYEFSNPGLAAITLLGSLCIIYADVMIAVVLSRAYLRDEAETGAPAPGEVSPTTPAVS